MLSDQIKIETIKAVIVTPSFLGKYSEYDGILTFLNKIFDLKGMPSTDGRFSNAYDDTYQHMINNSDWEYDYLFLERFNLHGVDEKYFIAFIETVVSPMVRTDRDDIIKFVVLINSHLKTSGFKLILTDYFEELPVFRYKNAGELDDLPIDIVGNSIPIYLSTNKEMRTYPCFSLSYDNWDDFGFKTTLYLTLHPTADRSQNMGQLKIVKRQAKQTWSELQNKFFFLDAEYCSLGQTESYYTELRNALGAKFSSFLLALRDVAIFPKINERFEKEEIYMKSLIRFNETERIVRTMRFQLESVSPNEYFKFNYVVQPPYSENTIPLNFDFEYQTDYEQRIFALIGKNGTGKTRILSSLAKDLSKKDATCFTPRRPVYGKIFTVSYSYFDRFEIPTSDASFNYVYCGLKKNDGSLKSEFELLEEFYFASNEIYKNGSSFVVNWYAILNSFLPQDIIEEIVFNETTDEYGNPQHLIDRIRFDGVKKKLSSGQSIVLFMVTQILSNIRFDSLILFDEPETHLHPNAISSLMNALFSLVKRFESFCVIATHSPLIIQELPAKNIFVIEREGNSASVRGLERESLGENLTVITNDIFGNREISKHYITSIENLISKGKTYQEIVELLESDSLTMTANLKLYIKTLLGQ